MTVFDIQTELGYTRRLVSGDLKPTPWFVSTAKGLQTNELSFTQVILSERGFMPLEPMDFETLEFNSNYDKILDELPEWCILTPRLYPAADNLQKSLDYELNLFLDRLDEVDLPKAFGLVYDPIHTDLDHLRELLKYKPSIIVIRFPNLEDESPRKMLPKIMELRKEIPPNVAMYIPGSGGLGYQTLLIALGIDIIDDLAAYRFAARQRGFIDQMIHYLPDYSMTELIKINLESLRRDFDNILFQIGRNGLWTKFAKDMHVHPHVASFRHLLAYEQSLSLDLAKFRKFSDNSLPFTGEEALYHPDVLAYQSRLKERYVERDEIKMIVLLPCSARKPYHESYSHRKYEKSIQAGAQERRNVVKVWSLTSPLGVVPRDIETVYPAANYDIPVTGNWSEAETRITGSLLADMLDTLDEEVIVVAHVSAGYKDMIEVAQERKNIIINWADHQSRSDEALENLSNTIRNNLQKFDPVDLGKKGAYLEARNVIQAITRYNHGPDVKLDFDYQRVRIIGRPPRPLAIQKDKQHWITWDKLGGDVRLHKRAVQDIAMNSINWILVTAEKLRGSNLFGIGVGEASTAISPGDEVIFFNEDKTKLLGIGVATVSGMTMNRVQSGLVASIRKKLQVNVTELEE